jgi:HAD superfamily hydrolase (TIGR01509 family)
VPGGVKPAKSCPSLAMILEPSVRAVIFDFDGVLADTEDLHCAAFQAVAKTWGLSLSREDYCFRYLGLPDRECLAAVWGHANVPLPALRLDALVAEKRACYAELSRTAALYPRVAAALRRLRRRYILAIASGAFRDEIEPVLVRAEVRDLFSAVVGADDVGAGKPAPEPFLQALVKINAAACGASLTAADCIAVEDSPHGIAAAHAAGMRCIAVTTTHAASELAAADGVIDHVAQLDGEEGSS